MSVIISDGEGNVISQKIKVVNVLGTEYAISFKKENEDKMLEKYNGYCDATVPEIVVCDLESGYDTLKDLEIYKKEILRHEIIHAFLNESGLKSNSEWARNEEMVDFFAIQFNKIEKAFKECDC